MQSTVFSLNDDKVLAQSIAHQLNTRFSKVENHHFPDDESCIRINPDDVTDQCIVIATLFHPDEKTLPILFLSETLREYGAKNIILIAPYLAYMRQDKRFTQGEGITAKYYGRLISQYFDAFITVDPHLHRIQDLNEVYSIPSRVVHAAHAVAEWIEMNINQPLLIGPDSESEQWVKDLANRANVPFIVLEKIRHGDRDVEVSVPEVERWSKHTPILFDDIISTGKTMIETINHLKRIGLSNPVCIGVHAVFSDEAYQDLLSSGAERVITANTISHPSNIIDLAESISNAIVNIELTDS